MVDMDHMDNVTFSLSDDISKNLVTPTNTIDVSSNALVVSANGWTPEIIRILDKIRINSMKMSDYHNKRYHTYKYYFYYYTRIPLIVLSGINTFVAIGLQPFTTQQNISVINALISLFCGVITSIELLVNLQKKMETELQSHKEYYRLAVFIYKVTKLDEKDRATEGRTYLNARISDYDKLIISSNVKDADFNINDDEFVDVVIDKPKTNIKIIKETCKKGIRKLSSFHSESLH
jgi:hypothetical protein